MGILDGKVAIVTGGSRGIGKAIVQALAEAGARVAFTYRSSTSAAEAFRDELAGRGFPVLGFQSDATSFKEAAAVVDAVLAQLGRLDILVNNAGITKDTLLLRMTEEDWDSVIGTNLKGVFNFTKAAIKPMISQRAGKIINISSIVGITGNAGQTNYAASKAGIIGFTKSVAKELGSRNIQVNVVAPGYVDTDMTGVLTPEQRKALTDMIPLKRTARPEDVASVVRFLASKDSDYMTGQTVRVDGGMTM